jgi:hypothetical protein
MDAGLEVFILENGSQRGGGSANYVCAGERMGGRASWAQVSRYAAFPGQL